MQLGSGVALQIEMSRGGLQTQRVRKRVQRMLQGKGEEEGTVALLSPLYGAKAMHAGCVAVVGVLSAVNPLSAGDAAREGELGLALGLR